MAQITQEAQKKESRFMTLFWECIKDFYEPEGADDYWQALIQRTDDIYKECSTELDKELLIAFINWTDKEYKARVEG